MDDRSEVLGQPSRIFIAPHQRLPDDLVFICAGEMPQEPFGGLLVNERGKAVAFWTPPGVQLNHILAVVDTKLKRWAVSSIFFIEQTPLIVS